MKTVSQVKRPENRWELVQQTKEERIDQREMNTTVQVNIKTTNIFRVLSIVFVFKLVSDLYVVPLLLNLFLDYTQIPGYQVIAADCPVWKRALIEKKNAQLIAEATVRKQLFKLVNNNNNNNNFSF